MQRSRSITLTVVCALTLLCHADARDIPPAAQRGEVCLNGDWQATAADADENALPDSTAFPTAKTLPVPGVFSPMFSAEMPGIRANRIWYRLEFTVPAPWQDGRRVTLLFRSVEHYGKVYVNRQALGEHFCGDIPFEFDATEHVSFDKPNELLVYVEDASRTISTPEAREKALATPWAGWKKRRAVARAPNDYPQRKHMPGISGDVYLRSSPAVYVSDVFVKPSVRKMRLEVQLWVTNRGGQTREVTVNNDIWLRGGVALDLPPQTLSVPAGATVDFTVSKPWPDPELWGYGEYGSPTLYYVRTELTAGDLRDTQFTRFGFRELWAEGKDFYFNGRKWFMQGDCANSSPYIYYNTRAFLARYLQVERQHNINNIRTGGLGPTRFAWFDLADEMGMTFQPCVEVRALPNPISRKNDRWFTEEYVKSIRNHPSATIINSNGEAASQGGGAISPGNDPEVWESLKLAQDAIKRVDGTRLVCHDGSPRIMLSERFGLEFPLDMWDIHPYGDPLVVSLRRHIQTFGYDGSVPCVLGEVVGKKVPLPKEIELLKEYPADAYNLQLLTAQYWRETIRDLHAEGTGGLRVLTLMGRAYWGASSPTEVSAGPYDGLPAPLPISWPSRSGPGFKTSAQLWGYKFGLVNYLRPDRPLVVSNVIGKAVREAYRETNGGKDLAPVPDKRAPEVIVTVTAAGKPAGGAYVYLTPLDGQATNVRGVMADVDGSAWFLLQEPGRYRAACTVDGEAAGIEITARYGSLKNDPMPWGHIDRVALAVGDE